MMASEIDADEMSISSEFSIIPECMVHGIEENTPQNPISMNASFTRSVELTDLAASSEAPKTVFNKVQFGTLQMIKDPASGPQGSFVVVFCCDPEFIMTKSDRIAVYKVGFSSAKDYICFVWVPVPSPNLDSLTDHSLSYKNTPITVKFEGSCFPKDEEESYQVCYLMHDGQIAGVSVPFQLKMIESSVEEEIENSARQVLSIRVRGLIQEQNDLRDSIQDLEIVCNNLRCENEELTESLKETQNALQSNKAHTEELEKEVAGIQSVKNSLEEKIIISEERGNVSEERNKVIMQDNVELKTCLQFTKEDLDRALKEKEAAEKIAVDLSHRLQDAHNENVTVSISNKKLLDKLKEIQLEKNMEETLKGGGWHCVPKVKQYDASEEVEEQEANLQSFKEIDQACAVVESVNEEVEELEAKLQSYKEEAEACAMVESFAPSVMTSVCHSSCSQNTKELAEAFSQKMEVIVSQLTLQKEQINSLKIEIEKNRLQSRSTSVESQVTATSEIVCVTEESNFTNNEVEDVVKVSSDSIPDAPKEAKSITDNCSNAPDDDRKILYGHTFLPASCTAPVFLPDPVTKQPPRSTLPSAPSSISMDINEVYSILTTDGLQQNNSVQQNEFSILYNHSLTPMPTNLDNYSQTSVPTILDNHNQTSVPTNLDDPNPTLSPLKSKLVTSSSENLLPPPLLPETTATARNAAVLNQYINESTMTNPFLNVEDNSQATGNIRQTDTKQNSITMLSCPMCQLSFEKNGIHLLQEHIDSHLEMVCPVCSTAFPRNTKQEEFEVHVHSHFSDEESINPSEFSGPWGRQRSTNRSFQLLEID